MKTISMSELRANLMNVIQQVTRGKTFLVTSYGKPVAQIVPPIDRRTEALTKLKAMRKTAIIGDIVSPTERSWQSD